MPPKFVKTIEELVYWEYAKLITKSAGFDKKNYGFMTSRWKLLKSGKIKMSTTQREWEIERDSRKVCIYCESIENIQTEHIIPKSKGGPNIADNLVDSCQSCNLKKTNRDVFEFCKLEHIEVPRIVRGKYLKLVYNEHEKKGTLQMSDIDGNNILNIYDLSAIFK